jgi:predicted branched-subunit amino acid permease
MSLSLIDRRLWRHPERRQGMWDMARVMPGLMTWALVTGVAMAKSGLPLSIALMMSLSVFAASAQLSAVPLMLAGAPIWVVWLTALCVNLRFVIFSAQMREHMMCLPLRWRLVAGYLTADVTYVMSVHRYGGTSPASCERIEPLAYFVGLAVVNWAGWNIASLCGVLFAAWVPASWGLGFAGTLALLGLLVTLAKDRQTLWTAGFAASAAVAAFALPFRLYIVVAVAAAVAAGLLMDAWSARAFRGPA